MLEFTWDTTTRHMRLIRSLIMDWPENCARECFLEVAKMKRLEKLRIGVDEEEMVRSMLKGRIYMPWYASPDVSEHQQLVMQRHPGMTGLLAISGVTDVQFTTKLDYSKDETGVRSRVASSKRKSNHSSWLRSLLDHAKQGMLHHAIKCC